MQATLAEVRLEVQRQAAACASARGGGLYWWPAGSPRLLPEQSLAILVEEVGEVARELCDARARREPGGGNLRVELIQVAAIAVAWADLIG